MSSEQKASSPALACWIVVAAAAYHFFVRPKMKRWGARLGEPLRRLPGDDLIPTPNFEMTHAVNIEVPPEAVWPWIAQMGRARTGFYGLDLLSNRGIPSVDFIRKDIPPLEVGAPLDDGCRVLEVVPARMLLYGGFDRHPAPGVKQDMTTLFLLERRSDGGTRMLVRRRASAHGPGGVLFHLGSEIVYFIYALQQRERLKCYAERTSYPRS